MTHDERAVMAASNNADLYQAVFDSWGLRYQRRTFAFIGTDRPPPYFSNLTVLSPDCGSQIMSELQALARCFEGTVSFKDSFCEFDRGANCFRLLFNAAWIWKAAEASGAPQVWTKVERPNELEKWELAWKRSGSPTRERMFRDSLLQSPHIAFLGRMEGDEFVCGCIASVSSECLGLSNLFCARPDGAFLEEARAAAASLNPRLPIVGYAAGPLLKAAQSAGFQRTGDLRILEARKARL